MEGELRLKQILENIPVGEYVSVVKNPKTGTFEDLKAALRSNNEVSTDV